MTGGGHKSMTGTRRSPNGRNKPARLEDRPTKPHAPTPREEEATERFRERRRRASPAPSLKLTSKDGIRSIEMDHPDLALASRLLMEAVGTTDADFLCGLLKQLANTGTADGELDAEALNFVLSAVKGVQPRDELEGMLAAQMAVVHAATMTAARRFNRSEYLPGRDSASRAMNQLARTYAAQMETLRRYRTGGEQKVTVEHVTVNQGGQAIVGNVQHGGRGVTKKDDTTP